MNVQSRSAYSPLNFGHQSGGAHRHAPHQDHHEHGPHCNHNHAHAPKEPHVHGPHCNHDHHGHDHHHDHGHKPAPSKPPFLTRLKNWLLAIPRFFADALKIFWRDITGKGNASQPHSH